MDYVKIQNGEVVSYPYTMHNLRLDNPNTSFPEIISENLLVDYGVFRVHHLEQPNYNRLTEKIVQAEIPTLINEQWCVGWTLVTLSAEEIADVITTQKISRQLAFTAEADPLFFKWQSGEGTQEEWIAKRQEIRDKYPYPSV